MWIRNLRLEHIKSFPDSGQIAFSKGVTLLVGANNAGKTTVLRSIYSLQSPTGGVHEFAGRNCRIGSKNYKITFEFADASSKYFKSAVAQGPTVSYSWDGPSSTKKVEILEGKNRIESELKFASNEPQNWIYPFLSRRKSTEFHENTTSSNAEAVSEQFDLLYSKVDRLCQYGYWAHEEYISACRAVFGYVISCRMTKSGKIAGLRVSRDQVVALSDMGEGSKNLLGLIVNLCVADGHLFVIEELENDIHPQALKAILELVLRKAEKNQFIVSTHSNIVLKHLGNHSTAKVFRLSLDYREGELPTSTISAVENSPSERIKLLTELGYDLFDFELWKAYLILEESSAERIIREFLIPWFAPKLANTLRTIAAQGANDLEARCSDFLRLFVFVHMNHAYAGRAWVIADGDAAGEDAIKSLRKKFEGKWDAKHFRNFQEPVFERYFPPRFANDVESALNVQNKQDKRAAKEALLNKVVSWIRQNPDLAKSEFETTAAEVISILKEIEAAF